MVKKSAYYIRSFTVYYLLLQLHTGAILFKESHLLVPITLQCSSLIFT